MPNPVKGICTCPLCNESGAEIREGVKGRLYIVCDGCVTMTTTMSRQGRALIENRLGAQAAPAPVKTKAAATGEPSHDAAPVAVAPKSATPPTVKTSTVPSFFGLRPS